MGSINIAPGPGSTSVSVTPPGESAGTVTTIETTGSFSVPAGAYWIEIKNAGIVQPGDQPNAATVQGASWSVGRIERWEAFLDSAGSTLYTLPAVTGNGNGARMYITYFS